jgi:hypothetical protein
VASRHQAFTQAQYGTDEQVTAVLPVRGHAGNREGEKPAIFLRKEENGVEVCGEKQLSLFRERLYKFKKLLSFYCFEVGKYLRVETAGP